jgi:C1A family cysteine protease
MNFLYIFALTLLISVLSPSTSSSDISQLFETWCKEHGKSYTSQEERSHRLKVFEDNYDFVTKHNSKGNSSYTLALNAFADLTHHEFKTSRLGLSAAPLNLAHRNLEITGVVGDIPASIDWRNKGAVTNVKDQESCGT